MTKKIVIIFSLMIISAAALSGALVIKNLFSKAKVAVNISHQLLANINQPAFMPLPKFEKSAPEVSLLAVGDIMLSRSVEQLMVKQKDFTSPFKPLAKMLSQADITFGNLETVILPGPMVMVNEFNFRADPRVIGGLQLAGFDLVSLANNHTPNFGQRGLVNTFTELTKAGIKFIGAGGNQAEAQKPAIIEKQGIKFGFLAYVYPNLPKSYQATANQAGVNFMNLDQLRADIANLKPQVDFVVVSMHDGVEYAAKPTQRQTEFARAAIAAGASLVIGHHPHVVQTVEKYQNGYIIYSLGNFIFDQLWSNETQRGMMAKIVFSQKEIKNIEFMPIEINHSFQPQLASEPVAQAVINRLAMPLASQPRFFWDGQKYQETRHWQINQPSAKIKNQIYQAADLDQDNSEEEVVVVDGIGYLIKDHKVLWQTDSSWKVDNALIGDFNNDHKAEIGFSLWKKGSYGPNLPFWEKENDKNTANHLFIYQFENNKLKMIWGSSALDQPIKEMALADLDGDGKNELIVLEGQAKNELATNLSIWRWHEWNLVNLYKSRQGNFFDMQTYLNYIDIKETK